MTDSQYIGRAKVRQRRQDMLRHCRKIKESKPSRRNSNGNNRRCVFFCLPIAVHANQLPYLRAIFAVHSTFSSLFDLLAGRRVDDGFFFSCESENLLLVILSTSPVVAATFNILLLPTTTTTTRARNLPTRK